MIVDNRCRCGLAVIIAGVAVAFGLLTGCQPLLGIDPDEDNASDSGPNEHAMLDYVEATVTVRDNNNHEPIEDALVEMSYTDPSGDVVHWSVDYDGRENTIGDSARTSSDGTASLYLNNARLDNTSYSPGDSRTQKILEDKTVKISVKQSDYATISDTREYSVELEDSSEFDDDAGHDIYYYYAASGSSTVYMSPD